MGIAKGITTLITELVPIVLNLSTQKITEEEARTQSRAAVDAFFAQLGQSRADDAARDAATDAKLDEIDRTAEQ